MVVGLLPSPYFLVIDAAGNAGVGYKVFTYAAGTGTPLATYQDPLGLTPHTNPIILDSTGRELIYLTVGVAYKFNVLDPANAQVAGWPVDDILIPKPLTVADVLGAGVVLTTATAVFDAAAFAGQGVITIPGWHPQGVLCLAMKLEVTQQFGASQGLLTLALGDPGLIDRWGSALTLTVGTKPQRFGGIPMFATPTDGVLSAEGGFFDGTGRATVTRLTLQLS